MNGTGIIIKQYTAKELNVSIGERVIGLEEFNGWVWGEGRDGEKEEMVRRAGYQRKTYKNINNNIRSIIRKHIFAYEYIGCRIKSRLIEKEEEIIITTTVISHFTMKSIYCHGGLCIIRNF